MPKNDKTYLDYNATSLIRPCALSATMNALEKPLNASSVHSLGREGHKIIEDTRAALSAAINCPAPQITFNSGATEGNNTIIHCFTNTYPDERILISAIEHSSINEQPAQNIEKIPTDKNGVIDLIKLEDTLKNGKKTSLVSIMFANNETGVIQPIKEAAKIAHSNGALFHCDATQGFGKTAIDMTDLNTDFLTLTSHKIGGPQGIGAIANNLCGISPILMHGGGQEKKQRPGTENVAAIAGFGAAIAQCCNDEYLTKENKRLHALQNTLETALKKIAPDIVIFGENASRLPNTSFFSLDGTNSQSMLMALDLSGIAVSNGSACSSGTVKTSHVLNAMNAPETLAKGALRISTGWNTTEDDIEKLITILEKIYSRQKGKIAPHA